MPSRSTVALTEIIALSLAAALSAFASWYSLSPTLRTIMRTITVPARGSPVENETVASTASRITSGLMTERHSSRRKPGR